MRDGARELFGDGFTFDGVEIAGRIDPLIWADVCRLNGIDRPEAHHDRFRWAYARHLARRMQTEPTARELLYVSRIWGTVLFGCWRPALDAR